MVKILRNLNRTIETETKLEAMASEKLSQLRKERVENRLRWEKQDSETREEDGDSNS
jgi:hypothetical protein